ncbi:PREDICTED: homeobox protein MSX-2-like [Nicrophorus vespilloides]|uniref:Homeobox protein MSX-2-like n=1 Tax=Nicrophorus vespilloides TaxID=110193 RepID=A0ABM1N3G4_NICVS|nr:PREDICTED: homeobox protein MSX-2-like [Nicrophorus vespilloides]
MTSSGVRNDDEDRCPMEQQTPRKVSDFSIDHILHKAGTSSQEYGTFDCGKPTVLQPFPWLQCTRYCPPKVPRKREGGPQKRQLGRHPRIPFTTHQLSLLEERFRQSPYLSSEEVTRLSTILKLADIRVKIWFQNRRARERRERQQMDNRKPNEATKVKQENNYNFDYYNSPSK